MVSLRILVFVIIFCAFSPYAGANDEYELYRRAGAGCKGEYAEQAAKVAFEKYALWKDARDRGSKPPAGAFRDAGQAFRYLVKNGCEDGLILYRYGNMLRHNKKCKQAIPVIQRSLGHLKENYPDYLNYAYFALAYCSTNLGKNEDAIKYYKSALEYDPNDVNSKINLCVRYYWAGRPQEARKTANYVLQKMGTLTSDYGKGICYNMLGWIALDEGSPEEAIENFRKAKGLRGRPADIEGLAWAYEKVDPEKAGKYWQRLLEIKRKTPRHRLRDETEEKLRKLAG